MTNEELEEFAREISYDLNDPFCGILEKDKIEYAVKKGFAEGKPKWHDLRKDPNDLPKENREYLVAYKNYLNQEEIVTEIFKWETYKFVDDNYEDIPYFDDKGVLVAWCEIPKFEE